jgi:macrolide-specific efflux system membrane fusion protein
MAMADTAASADKDFSTQFLASRKKKRRRRMIAFLTVVAGVGGYYYWTAQQGEVVQEDEALIVAIDYGDIENAIPASGTLQPKEVVPVGARASGELTEIYVEVGDFVEEGQELAQIDASEQALRVRSSELSLQNQKNQVEQRELDVSIAEKNLVRTQALAAAEASTEQELENAEKSLLSAKTSLANLLISIEQSETSLEQERVQLNYTTIKAPLAGTIISLDQKEGATLNASQTAPTVMQIADLTTLTVETEISEADISAVKEGVEVYFTTLGGGDRRWEGTLRQIDPLGSVSSNVVLFKGHFDVDNSDGELYPGMTTQVFFVTSQARNVLTVPVGALTFNDAPSARGGAQMSSGQSGEGAPNGEELAARAEQFGRGGGEVTPEMRARIEQMRQSGGFDGGSFPSGGFSGGGGGRGGFGGGGRGGPPGGGTGGAGAEGSLLGSIALSEPRNATVQLVQPDGSFVAREIVVGAMDRVNAEVISGLEQGDRVVAGVVQARTEDEQDSSNSGNFRDDRYMRGMSGGGFRPF